MARVALSSIIRTFIHKFKPPVDNKTTLPGVVLYYLLCAKFIDLSVARGAAVMQPTGLVNLKCTPASPLK